MLNTDICNYFNNESIYNKIIIAANIERIKN